MQPETEYPLPHALGGDRKMDVLGHEVTVRLSGADTDGEYFVFEDVTPPGAGVPLHVHRREDEFFRVLDGEFEVQIDHQTQQVTSGAMFCLPRDIPHGYRNMGTTPGRILFTVMPGGNFEKFFNELGALPTDEEPDTGKVAEIFARYGIKILPPD